MSQMSVFKDNAEGGGCRALRSPGLERWLLLGLQSPDSIANLCLFVVFSIYA